jgi:hypothetical protein
VQIVTLMFMIRESKTLRDRRKELSKLPDEELEGLSGMYILFKDSAPRSVRQRFGITKALAQEILEARLAEQGKG